MQGGRVRCVEIAGRGIGGLVAGLAFARCGWEVGITSAIGPEGGKYV